MDAAAPLAEADGSSLLLALSAAAAAASSRRGGGGSLSLLAPAGFGDWDSLRAAPATRGAAAADMPRERAPRWRWS